MSSPLARLTPRGLEMARVAKCGGELLGSSKNYTFRLGMELDVVRFLEIESVSGFRPPSRASSGVHSPTNPADRL